MITTVLRVTIYWFLTSLYVDSAQHVFNKSDDWDAFVWMTIYMVGLVILAPWIYEKLFD